MVLLRREVFTNSTPYNKFNVQDCIHFSRLVEWAIRVTLTGCQRIQNHKILTLIPKGL